MNVYKIQIQNTTIYIMQSTNNQDNMDDTREYAGQNDYLQYYRTGKTITVLLYSQLLEILSILCVISCIILLLLCTLTLTMSLYFTEMVKNNYNKHKLPNLKNIISVYIDTVSEQLSNYITLSKLMASSNIIIKQESDSSSNNSEDLSNEQISDTDDDDVSNDSQRISSTDNSINKNEMDVVEALSESNETSDIEDITEKVLENKMLNRDIVDLTNNIETSSDSDATNHSDSRPPSINSDIMNESSDNEDLETKKNN